MTKYSTIPLLLICFIAQAQYSDCGLDNTSIHLAKLIVENSEQKRSTLKCNKLLAIAAHQKAKTLANTNEISHTIDHVTANEFLENHGIKLPANYQVFGNQVEAIQGGMETSQEALDYFMTSKSHKEHILGETSFYQQQNQIGVGHFYDDKTSYEDFWVVYITKTIEAGEKEGSAQINQKKQKIVFKIENNKKRKRFKKGDTLSSKKLK